MVGGGISGIAAALKLLELKKEKKLPIEVILLESSQRLGGVISSFKWHQCLLEIGPDAVFTEKPQGLAFIRKIGLESDIVQTNPQCRKSYIAMDDALHPVPEGFYLLAPTKLWPLLTTPIFSIKAKLRMLLEPLIPRKNSGAQNGHVHDESLDSFVRRRLGREALERMAQPMVAGIYSADPKELSLASTFPKFLEWERQYGSVVWGIWRRRAQMKLGGASGPRYSLFISLKDGMQSLIDAAAAKIPAESVRIGAELRSISRDPENKRFKLRGADFEMEADAICLALPAPKSAELVRNVHPELAGDLSKIQYASGMTVNLVFDRAALPQSPQGFGFVVPAVENRLISGCTFASVKFLGRSPDDKIILRAFIGGGSAVVPWMSKTDAEIVGRVRLELAQILKLTDEPKASFVHRYHTSTPQYKVGHLDLLNSIDQHLKGAPGIALAGNAYGGIGIPDCIQGGENAADKLCDYLFSGKN